MPPVASLDRRARAFATMLLAMVVAASITSACTLDWKVRPDPGDASILTEGGTDAPVGPDATDSAVVDADAQPGLDGADCTALAAAVAKAKAKAKECTLASGQCMSTVDDECDCPVVIRAAGTTQNTDYANAIAALIGACGKPATCGACPALGMQSTWTCLANGPVNACFPF